MAIASFQLLPPTGNGVVDALTNGTHWLLDNTRTVQWAIADAPPGDWKWSVAGAETLRIAASAILADFAEVANIRFEYTGTYGDVRSAMADIAITATTRPFAFSLPDGAYARSFFPNEIWADTEIQRLYGSTTSYPDAAGDVVLNFASTEILNSSFRPGSTGHFALMQELAHAVGLKHPQDNSGNPSRPTFQQLGFSLADTQLLTVMSNETATDIARLLQQYKIPADVGYPSSLMPLDVIALQALYGPNMATRAGDTLYELFNDDAIETWWDAGGADVLSAARSAFGWNIVAVNLEFATLVAAQPSDWGSTTGKYYFNVETLEGSAHDDTIVGHALENTLSGLAGDDLLSGGGGNDRIDGGSGMDFGWWLGARRSFQITIDDTGVRVRDLVGREGTDWLTRVERLVFADRQVAVDVGPGEAGLEAALLLRTLLGPEGLRDPGLNGLVLALLDVGVSFETLMGSALQSPLFLAAAGGASDTQFIRQVYRSVVGIEPSSADLSYFNGLLGSGTFTRLDLALLAATSDFNVESAEITGVVTGGLDYVPYTG